MGRFGKALLWLVVGLIGLVFLVLVVLLLVYPPEYVYRMLAWRESDYYDYLNNFPMRPLAPAPVSFTFDKALDEEGVSQVYETILDVDDFEAFLEETGTQAFLVIQDDAILYEKYFNGAQWDTLLTSFSVAKSFTSALIGIAITEGYIDSVNDPVTKYLPELAERDPRFDDITIRHLLLMASGLDYRANRPALFNGDDALTTYYPDQRQAALEFPDIVQPAGQAFSYNKYHPQLLGMILERSTGVAVTEYLQEKLWNPLGMEYGGGWSLDSEESGFEKMESGVNARALDYAKLGRLYLEHGNWNGEQVIPAEWVTESTQVDPDLQSDAYYPDAFGQTLYNGLDGYYKYMWYGLPRDGDAYDFAAMGDRGQVIYVSPQKKMIIIRNGLEYGEGLAWDDWLESSYRFASEY